MTPAAAAVAAAGVGAAAAVILLSDWTPMAAKSRAVAGGWQGSTWSPGKPRPPYFCRGGLYHPPVAGEGRTGLLMHGWGWIADPPAEHSGPGVSDG